MAAANILFQASAMPNTVTVPPTSTGNGRGRVPQPTKMPAWIKRPNPIVITNATNSWFLPCPSGRIKARSVTTPISPAAAMAARRPAATGSPADISVPATNTASVPMSPIAKLTVSVERKMITMPSASSA